METRRRRRVCFLHVNSIRVPVPSRGKHRDARLLARMARRAGCGCLGCAASTHHHHGVESCASNAAPAIVQSLATIRSLLWGNGNEWSGAGGHLMSISCHVMAVASDGLLSAQSGGGGSSSSMQQKGRGRDLVPPTRGSTSSFPFTRRRRSQPRAPSSPASIGRAWLAGWDP